MKKDDIEYFQRGEHENARFWARLGGRPGLDGLVVLDLGCGHGSLCIDIALSGAKKVIGLDLNQSLIDFANENLRSNYQKLINSPYADFGKLGV